MRLFIGIKLDKITNKINAITKYLYQEGLRGNYTLESNYHVTLAFIGECTNDICLDSLIDKLNSINISHLEINKIKKMKDMLVLELVKDEELLNAEKQVKDELSKQGFNYDKKTFNPHITLVREIVCNENKLKEITNKKINVSCNDLKVNLFESKRINGKLVYELIINNK